DPAHEAVLEGELRCRGEFGAGVFEEFVIDDAGWAGGFASAAVEAEIEMMADGGGGFDFPIGQAEHGLETPARRIGFVAGFHVGWAGRETEAAVNAGEPALVGLRLEMERGGCGPGCRGRVHLFRLFAKVRWISTAG